MLFARRSFPLIPLFVLCLLFFSCRGVELKSLQKPGVSMARYRVFTLVNQAKSEHENYLRDQVLLNHVSVIMTEMGYSQSSGKLAQSHITLVFNEGFQKVYIPPSVQPIMSYTPGEFTTVTGRINGETVSLFGYNPPRRVESYVEIPAHSIDVYKIVLRIDIYDAQTLDLLWTGTASMDSSPAKAVDDARRMIGALLQERLPRINTSD